MYKLLIIIKFMKNGWELEGGSTSVVEFASVPERDRAKLAIEHAASRDDKLQITLVKM